MIVAGISAITTATILVAMAWNHSGANFSDTNHSLPYGQDPKNVAERDRGEGVEHASAYDWVAIQGPSSPHASTEQNIAEDVTEIADKAASVVASTMHWSRLVPIRGAESLDTDFVDADLWGKRVVDYEGVDDTGFDTDGDADADADNDADVDGDEADARHAPQIAASTGEWSEIRRQDFWERAIAEKSGILNALGIAGVEDARSTHVPPGSLLHAVSRLDSKVTRGAYEAIVDMTS